jgi:hypothetical protein
LECLPPIVLVLEFFAASKPENDHEDEDEQGISIQ